MNGCKLSPVGLGLALGILWGVSLLVLGLIATYYSYGRPFVDAVSALYLGFEPSVKGSIIGGIIGFIDAFITGFLIAWLYNHLRCGSCCCSTPEKTPAKRAKSSQV